MELEVDDPLIGTYLSMESLGFLYLTYDYDDSETDIYVGEVDGDSRRIHTIEDGEMRMAAQYRDIQFIPENNTILLFDVEEGEYILIELGKE